MNGKGSSARPFSVNHQTFSENCRKSFKNPRDLYRDAVISPDFREKYPELTGIWAEDREKWLQILTTKGY